MLIWRSAHSSTTPIAIVVPLPGQDAVTSRWDVLCSTWAVLSFCALTRAGLRRATKESAGVITAKVNSGLCANIGVKSTRAKSEEAFDSYWWEVQPLSQSEGLERMLERGDNGRQGMERERTSIGSLYHRIQEVKSGAVMPWTGHTYSTGDIRFVDQQT